MSLRGIPGMMFKSCFSFLWLAMRCLSLHSGLWENWLQKCKSPCLIFVLLALGVLVKIIKVYSVCVDI
jgi:hypothetical protein